MRLLGILGIIDAGGTLKLLELGFAEVSHRVLRGGGRVEVLCIANVGEVALAVAEVVAETIVEGDESFVAM
jgi:hypothetical protein